MSKLGTVRLQPEEIRHVTVDYSDFLDIANGEALDAALPTLTITPVTTPPLVVVPIVLSATQIRLTMSGGQNKENYLVEVLAATDKGQLKEDEIVVKVKDL